jgi:hypothetical protein
MREGKAFDAVESYLCDDAGAASSQWRTVSLVTAVRGLLQRGPQFERPSPAARYEAFRAAHESLRGPLAEPCAKASRSRPAAPRRTTRTARGGSR